MFKHQNGKDKPVFPYQNIQTLKEYHRLGCFMLALPVEKWGRTIPFGYRQHPDDPEWLIPNADEYEVMVKARAITTHIVGKKEGYGDHVVADWVNEQLGRKAVSHSAIRQIYRCRPPLPECLLPLEEKMELLCPV